LLLPLFFAFSGVRTQIGLLNDSNTWTACFFIILIAVVGKFGGSMFAARFVGQNWQDSIAIGALMNTRGLMELIVLNIGYDLGVLTPTVFAMMVLMALVTTFMTGPSLDLLNRFGKKEKEIPDELKEMNQFKVLISIGKPESGPALLRLSNALVKKLKDNASITAMHLTPANELFPHNSEEYENESFSPVIEESRLLKQQVTTFFKVSSDIDTDITDVANKGDYDLLIIGLGKSIFEGSLLGNILGFTTRIINPEKILNTVTGKDNLFINSPFDERTKAIVEGSKIPVGILIDKDLQELKRIFIPVFNPADQHLITYAQKFIHNSEAQVLIMDCTGQIKNDAVMKERIRSIEQTAPNHISLESVKPIDKEFLKRHDLMVLSLASWRMLVQQKTEWLNSIPSTLIISDK
jgi:hypothetical protein